MSIGLAILYGVAVMTAAVAAAVSVLGFVGGFTRSKSYDQRFRDLVVFFIAGSIALSITIWLLGV